MREILRIGKALYEVDHQTKIYWYYGRNPEKVNKAEEERNKEKIDGFARLFRDGRSRRFRYLRYSR
jgi:hypothetical protein